jgi:peptidoglycan/xylan/chitin deacetylase (PgdA/CDA1 family)
LENPSSKRFVCFTFDDGYRDNLSLALPIFERRRLPLTVFVTTCFIDRSMNVWWAGLVELLKRVDSLELSALDRTFDTSTFERKVHAYRLLGGAVSAGTLSKQAISDLLRSHGITCEAILDRDALTESEVRDLARHPLVTIGGHTHSHPRLSSLSQPNARQEMKQNKDLLEELTGRQVHHFAYPYGDRTSCGEREFALARELGFRSGLTTQIGNLGTKHLSCPTGLPRLRPFNQHESIRLLEFQRSGAANAVGVYFGRDTAIA